MARYYTAATGELMKATPVKEAPGNNYIAIVLDSFLQESPYYRSHATVSLPVLNPHTIGIVPPPHLEGKSLFQSGGRGVEHELAA